MQHRSSLALSAESHALLAQLELVLRDAPLEADDPASRAIQRRFSECRIGFVHALREWPENDEAIDGFVDSTLVLAAYHLERGDGSTAESLVAELRDVPPRFEARVVAIREGVRLLRVEADKLQRLGEQMDDTRSRGARAIFVIILTTLFMGPIGAVIVLGERGLYTWQNWHSVVYTGLLAVGLGALATIMRRSLMPNRLSRRYVTALVLVAVLVFVRRLLANALGHLEIGDASMDVFLFGAGCGVIGVLTDRRFFAPASAFLLASVSTALFPAHALVFMCLSGVLGPGFMAHLWLKSDERKKRRDEQRPIRRRTDR